MPNIFTIGGKTVADVQIGGKTVQTIYDNTHSVLLWEKSSAEPDYFYFEDRSGAANSVTLAATLSGEEWVSLEYSTDGSSWSTWDISQSLPIAANGRVYLRGDNGRMATNSTNKHTFSTTGDVYAGGNAVTMLDSGCDVSNVTLSRAFAYLFENMTTLVGVASGLFAGMSTGGTDTFRQTFSGCNRLANVPSLNITAIEANTADTFRSTFYQCYALTDASNITFGFTTTYARTLYQTFTGCSALVTPPDLSSITTLGTNALQMAFSGCTRLTSLKVGFTDWGDGTATRNWTRSILTNGVFYCPVGLHLERNTADGTTTADYIPYNWTALRLDGTPYPPYIEIDAESGYIYMEDNGVGGDAVIHYTTDGSTPTASSSSYSQEFFVPFGTTVKAVTTSSYATQASAVTVFPPDGDEWCNYFSYYGYSSYDDCMCQNYGEHCPPEPVDCNDWENMGYSSYEDCDCIENNNCGGDVVDCSNYGEYGYSSEDECMCAEFGVCDEPVDCSDWENLGYMSYADCDCSENNNCTPVVLPNPSAHVAGESSGTGTNQCGGHGLKNVWWTFSTSGESNVEYWVNFKNSASASDFPTDPSPGNGNFVYNGIGTDSTVTSGQYDMMVCDSDSVGPYWNISVTAARGSNEISDTQYFSYEFGSGRE